MVFRRIPGLLQFRSGIQLFHGDVASGQDVRSPIPVDAEFMIAHFVIKHTLDVFGVDPALRENGVFAFFRWF